MSCGLEQLVRPPLWQDRVVVAERHKFAAGGGEPLVHAPGKPKVVLVENGLVGSCMRVARGFPFGAVVDHGQLIGHVGMSPG